MKYNIDLLIFVVGLSGAGKSTASKVLSDLGFYAIDNLPVGMFNSFLDYAKLESQKLSRSSIMLDIASKSDLQDAFALIDKAKKICNRIEIIFLDCSTSVIIRRYSETRRPHPNFNAVRDKTLEDTIKRERNRFSILKEKSSFVIDTSNFTVHDLKREIINFTERVLHNQLKKIIITLMSFGFKHGVPLDCDNIIDVRFLPNPYFEETLKNKTGLDKDVQSFVFSFEETNQFLDKYSDLLRYLIPKYEFEGKSYLKIGIGCTGGKHRSVAIVERLKDVISDKNRKIYLIHRDL